MHKGIRISAAAAGLTMLIGASGVPTAEAADRLSERASAQLPAFNLIGLSAYAIGSFVAYTSAWIAPLVGVLVAAFSYALLETVVAGVKARRASSLSSI